MMALRCDSTVANGEWRVYSPDWFGGRSPVFGSPNIFACIAWMTNEARR
jgi:hypothetical protein